MTPSRPIRSAGSAAAARASVRKVRGLGVIETLCIVFSLSHSRLLGWWPQNRNPVQRHYREASRARSTEKGACRRFRFRESGRMDPVASLRAFVAGAKTGSLRAGAQKLELGPPAGTQRLPHAQTIGRPTLVA